MKMNFLSPIKKADVSMQRKLQKLQPKKHFDVDVFLKWAPIVALFALDVLDKKDKDKLEKHLIEAAVAEVLLNAAVQPLKYIYKRPRPNGKLKSFPSAHTATSFLGSELLHQEWKDRQPALSCTGYVVSAGTAVLRMYHNKHWFSDVLAGAVLGVLSAKLSPRLIDKVIYSTNIQPAV
ncbi:phosphatase PAP2 family protein [Ilyomonas limi]|uniref:Phosphatase PAP2 family protein n=1 Tax=Ilyomonas limi TaxID=2575867 RepID=A0A4U3L215_9BACT|nr:phosphatase PAP2 family protein [Ilyomonas limi]TKK67507.1 phosphatase PAP2 family protein [Ilyomonas limi]